MLKLIACLFGHRLIAKRRALLPAAPSAASGEIHTASTLPSDFIDIEIAQARRHRQAVGLAPLLDHPDSPHDAAGIPGLAISGGGIRSAVFSLGVLQAMADQHVLKHFGYVSTVSGGSYIGAFYGSLFVPDTLRSGSAQTAASEFKAQARQAAGTLGPKTCAATPASVTSIAYLRDNCNYLVPNGMNDVLQSIAFSLRNWFALQYVIGVSLLTVLLWVSLANHTIFHFARFADHWHPLFRSVPGLLAIGVSILLISPLSRAYWLTQNLAEGTRSAYKVLPAASLILVTLIALVSVEINRPGTILPVHSTTASSSLINYSFVGLGSWFVILTEILAVIAFATAWSFVNRNASPGKSGIAWRAGPRAKPASRLDSRAFADRLRNALTNAYTTPLRIGRHRFFSGPVQVMIWAAAIAAIDALGQIGYACAPALAGHMCVLAAASGATTTAAASADTSSVPASLGVLAGSGAAIWGAAKFLLSEGSTVTNQIMKVPKIVLASVAAILAALITLTFWSIAARAADAGLRHYARKTALLDNLSSTWRDANHGGLLFLGLTCVVILMLAVIDGLCIQFLNLSTYQRFYSTRLTRAFIGATNRVRLDQANRRDVTALVPGDSIAMGQYYHGQSCAPVHLINTTINKTIDWNSSLVQRGSRGMIMSIGPAGMTVGAKLGVLKCEWDRANDISTPATHTLSGHPTPNIWLESLTLGDWIAISGAAVSTGLGQLTRPGYSLLLGIANIRLGYWWDTYSAPFRHGTKSSPRTRVPLPDDKDPKRIFREKVFGTQFCLTSELLGQFDGPRGRRWYLTDGGHFENTGAYELLRRQLAFIVIFDNGCDPVYQFDDLANLMRRVRVDFGIEIFESSCKISSPDGLRLNPSLIAKSFDAFAKNPDYLAIRLMARFPDGRTGQILAIKPRLTAAAPHDVRQYKNTSPDFPHETTADQFFDDVQWESHRALGYSQARALFS
ncbi:patatin-like phospholipase family protein [Burkholderia sp. S171]|uniref:patatin-like phospholipase family protein n=1 Tax=Burkholderia sp. S171 TaxID=1641860 RepID=UPI00131D63E3|nr:patatin-like phospholipase family protein [Burkholderia sp. S171]